MVVLVEAIVAVVAGVGVVLSLLLVGASFLAVVVEVMEGVVGMSVYAAVTIVVKDLVGAGGVIATLVRVVNAVAITLELGVSPS